MARRPIKCAPFVVTVAVATAAVACGGSVDSDGSGGQGGAAAGSGSGGTAATAAVGGTGGTGNTAAVGGSGGTTGACPPTAPNKDAPCAPVGLSCSYDGPTNPNCPPDQISAVCAEDKRWDVDIAISSCNPPPPDCPPEMPTSGTACIEGWGSCSYTGPKDSCGQVTKFDASCNGGKWDVQPLTPPCAPKCPATQPKQGSACVPPPEKQCWYKTQCCPDGFECIGGTWQQAPSTCNPPPPQCPVQPPGAGTKCDPCANSYCTWDFCAQGAAIVGKCVSGVWSVEKTPCAG